MTGRLPNDCFALPPGVYWTPVTTALSDLRARLSPVAAREDIAISRAVGRVLADPVIAQRSHPPMPNSAVDGYAFCAPAHSPLRLLSGRAAAGEAFGGDVGPGEALRILTGAVMPKGADTVILQEDCQTITGQLHFDTSPKRGSNARAAGEDMTKGQRILEPGRRLTPGDIGAAIAAGIARVTTYRPLKVAVLSTGAELVPAGAPTRPDQIYDANGPMLAAMLDRAGYDVIGPYHITDDRAALRAQLDALKVDAIVTSGGASAGEEDHVAALLAQAGTRHDWRIAVKPGRPLVLGQWQHVPVFGLPGNPVAAFTTALLFAWPALGLLQGAGWSQPPAWHLPAAFSKRKKAGRQEYLRARITDGAVEIFPSEGSGRVSGLSWAQGFVRLDDPAQEIAVGDLVAYLPFTGFGL